MPIHDWTRVGTDTFHAFHTRWITHLSDALNKGALPSGYYADPEQQLAPLSMPGSRTLTIRHTSGHRIVALIEVLSPGNKAGADDLAEFVRKAKDAIHAGIHLTVIDLLPPGSHDPEGIHGQILAAVSGESYELPAGKALTFVSYLCGSTPVAYPQHSFVGDELPGLPLFLTPNCYVDLPLGATYAMAWSGMPAFWREVIEGKREHLALDSPGDDLPGVVDARTNATYVLMSKADYAEIIEEERRQQAIRAVALRNAAGRMDEEL